MKRGKEKRLSIFFVAVIILSFLLFIVFLTACGRRADPVIIVSYEKKPIKKISYDNNEKQGLNIKEKNHIQQEAMEVVQPEAPTGLKALFTQKSVILTWDEVSEQEVKLYRIYRSTGSKYVYIGTTVTPAFTDKNIKINERYHYRVTAVGSSESPPSKEIEVFTEAVEVK